MAGLRAFCEDIHRAVAEANHDWSDASVATALDQADNAYLTKCHGIDHQSVDRTKIVTCIQNWRHRLRGEYTRLYGKDDAGLVDYLATANLLPTEKAAFVAMTQSRRLKSAKSAPYTDIPGACWGGAPWRALGCARRTSAGSERHCDRPNAGRRTHSYLAHWGYTIKSWRLPAGFWLPWRTR